MKFKIGDIVIPKWGSKVRGYVFEVTGYDGQFVKAVHIPSKQSTELIHSSITSFFESEISVDVELTRDNKLSKLIQ